MKIRALNLLAPLLVGFSAPLIAADALEIQGMSVKGNAEQPKVLYIVPWQATTNPQDIYHPPVDKIEGAIQYLEPDEFQKQLYFRQNLKVNVESMPKN
jgi:hypothetical protein